MNRRRPQPRTPLTHIRPVRKKRQFGAAMAEFLVATPALLLLGLGGFQGVMAYNAKTVLDYATFEAARTGAVTHAQTGPMRETLGLRLAPVFGGDGSAKDAIAAITRASLDTQDTRYTKIQILNPTQQAFDDFGGPSPIPGVKEIQNSHLKYLPNTPGATSQVSIQDANLLKIKVTYGYRLTVPLISNVVTALLEKTDPKHAVYYAANRIPIQAVATVRMQSEARPDGNAPVDGSGGTPPGNPPDDPPSDGSPPGDTDPGDGDPSTDPVDDPDTPSDPDNGDNPLCQLTNSCSDPGDNDGDPQSCSADSGGDTGNGDGLIRAFQAPPTPLSSQVSTLPSLSIGNPIHVVTGNKYQGETDLTALPGALGLRFVRHYNSRRETNGANGVLGYGWTHSFTASLTYHADADTYRLQQSDGRGLTFTASGNDKARYLSTRAGDGWLTQLPDQTVRWYDRTGGWRTFNQQGQLQTIATAQGKRLTLHYNTNDHLQRVVDPQGRELTLGYYPSGRIKLLIAPDGAKTTYRYDTHQNLITVTRHHTTGQREPAEQTTRTYHYEDKQDAHNLTGITDERGVRYASWAYDDQDRAISSEHANEVGKVTLNFDTPNQTNVTDSQGKISTYTTTTEGGVARVLRIDGPGCDTCGRGDVEYRYNDQYQLTQLKKKDGSTTDYAYDDKGRTTGITQHNPNIPQQTPTTLAYEYDGRLQPSAIVKASINPNAKHRTELTYNAQGQPIQLTEKGYRPSTGKTEGGFEAIARTTTLTYNAQGDLITIDGPRTDVEDIITLSYDAKLRLNTLTTPDGIVQQVLAYDKLGRPTQLRKGTQTPTSLSYTERGQISEVIQGVNKVRYAYDKTGQLTGLTGPDGETLTLAYDDAGRATQMTGPTGEQLNTELDTEGRLTQRQLLNPQGSVLATVSYLYDAQGRLQSATQNGTEVTRYAYNAQGQLTQVQNPDGHATELSYNGIGQLLSLTQPGNVTTQLTYTDNGQANGIIDARNNATTYATDDFGNRITHTSADTGTQTYAYDQAGNRIQQTDAEGHTTTYTYDAANRLIEEHNSAGKTVLSYHPTNGLLETITDATSTENFDYNDEGQLTAQTREIDGHRFTTGYSYHADTQKLTQKTLPDGQVLNYHYYADGQQSGQLRAITTPGFLGLTQHTLIGEIDEDKTDGTTSLSYGNGTKTITRYNAAGQVNAIENTKALALQYQYDEHGQITGIDLNGSLQTYQYDQLGRLTSADTTLGDYRYAYDAVGNRTQKQHTDQTGHTQTDTYTYAKAGEGNRLVNTDTSSEQDNAASPYAYNEAGSPTRAGDLSYEYNRQQRPIKVYKTNSDSNNSSSKTKTLIAEYAYNRFGERIKKVVYSNSKQPKVTYYLYDGHSLTAEANAQGKITAQYLYFKNQPFTKLEGKRVYALHTDNLGTPRAATDKHGKTVWAADYSPFGKAQITTQNIALNLRFPGQYEDRETGKYYNYQRTYDPDAGRYSTSDPIGLKGGINAYAYVSGNPLSGFDPLGLATFYDGFSTTFLQDFATTNPVEHALFKQYATGISTDLWPSSSFRLYELAWRNFDSYVRNEALKLSLNGVQGVQNSIYGPQSWLSKILGTVQSLAVKCGAVIIGLDSDVGTITDTGQLVDLLPRTIILIRQGPQVINEITFRDAYGVPYDPSLNALVK